MAERNEQRSEQLTLALFTLTPGAVLPGIAFTLALESEDSRIAVEAVRESMTFHLASKADEVLAAALEPPAAGSAASGGATRAA